MTLQGLTTSETEASLSKIWLTKERLKVLVPSTCGRRVLDDDGKLWHRFCGAYDEVRCKLIHAARELDREKTERAFCACRDMRQWLEAIA